MQLRRLLSISLAILAAGLLVCGDSRAREFRWPAVHSLHETFNFPDATRAHASIQIRGEDGKSLYALECHPRSYEGDRDFDYSGDFECRLKSLYATEVYSTLLTEDPFQSRDWQSRARFFAWEVSEQCSKYPEFGSVRHFRLRGMRLTLGVQNPYIRPAVAAGGKASPILKSFGFEVRVDPDPEAISSIAEPAAFRPPDNGVCTNPIPHHVPGAISKEYIESFKGPYPEVVATEKSALLPVKTTRFEAATAPLPKESVAFYLPITNSRGKTVYRFECSAYIADHGGDILIGRWGISCGLFAAESSVNLLADSIDRYTRANRADVLLEQLNGPCGEYPEWGAERHFDLRGFRLTMQFRDVLFAEGAGIPDFFRGGIKRVKMIVRVRPRPGAKDPIEMPSRYVYWGLLPGIAGCGEVFIAHDGQ